jgi:hypothetical protein
MIRKKVEITIRSESYVEVLENALGRKLDHSNAADMGLLDQFVMMNKRLDGASLPIKQQVRRLWEQELRALRAESSDQQKESK